MTENIDYNTALAPLKISEYGRNFQNMVRHLLTIEDRDKRTKLAHTLVDVMINLNPSVKELEDYKQKLWDHLFIVSDYQLDVDAPFPKPAEEAMEYQPNKIPYKESLIKFRFYGRNLQNMVDAACEMEEGEMKDSFVNYIASFMVNSSRNWNKENLEPDSVAQHMKTLSKGRLQVNPDDLEIHIEKRRPNKGRNFQRNNNKRKKKRRNNR